MKTLIVCCTRERPERAKKMLDSIIQTTSGEYSVIFLIDIDDPKLNEYIKLLYPMKCNTNIGIRQTTTFLINTAFSLHNNFDYYHITNDDFIYKTKDWNKKFIDKLEENKYGVCYGNDLLQKENMPTAPFISGNIVRELGWLQMPTLKHLGGDCVWGAIGKGLNKLFYFPEIIIEHVHYQARKAVIDNVYQRTNSSEMYQKDSEAYREWYKKEYQGQIDRIRMVLHD